MSLDISFLLSLQLLSGFGYRSIQKCQKSGYTPPNLKELYYLVLSINKKIHLKDLEDAYKKSEEVLKICQKASIHILDINHPDYPSNLLSISSPPHLLFAKGNVERLKDTKRIAVIGCRTPGNYIRKAAKPILKILVENNFTIVSGLALGCDTLAHEECLNFGGNTLAILPSGIKNIYPRSNRSLANRILDSDGCLLSEYEPNAPALKNQFIERDRLQSGISSKVLILETDMGSGTMHTADFAVKQGKDLACILSHPAKYLTTKELEGSLYLVNNNKAKGILNRLDLFNFI